MRARDIGNVLLLFVLLLWLVLEEERFIDIAINGMPDDENDGVEDGVIILSLFTVLLLLLLVL